MPLSPYPRQAPLVEPSGAVSPQWESWLNVLRARILELETQVAALEARVTTLEGP